MECQRTFLASLVDKEPGDQRRIDQEESECGQRDANYDQIRRIAGRILR